MKKEIENNSLEAWLDLCEEWRESGANYAIGRKFAYTIMERCDWIVNNITLHDLVSPSSTLAITMRNFKHYTSVDELEKIRKNDNLLTGWELRGGNITEGNWGGISLVLTKKHVQVFIDIHQCGSATIKYKAICMGEDEWKRFEYQDIKDFYKFCQIWMSDKSAYEISQELEHLI